MKKRTILPLFLIACMIVSSLGGYAPVLAAENNPAADYALAAQELSGVEPAAEPLAEPAAAEPEALNPGTEAAVEEEATEPAEEPAAEEEATEPVEEPAEELAEGEALVMGEPPLMLPRAPQSLLSISATGFGTSVILSWDAVDNASSYTLERKHTEAGSEPYELLSTQSGTGYLDQFVPFNTGYDHALLVYRVIAYDADQAVLEEAEVEIGLEEVPQISLTVTAPDTESLDLTWTAVSRATEYIVYRADDAEGPYAELDRTASLEFADEGLTPGTTYYYRVVGVDNNNSARGESAPVAGTTGLPAPTAPQNVRAVALDSSSIEVSWDPVDGAEYYLVYVGPREDLIVTEAGTSYSTVMIDTGLAPDTDYYYDVVAVTAGGSSPHSDYAHAKTLPLAPDKPTGVRALALDTSSILVYWNAVANATSYNLYRSTAADGVYELATTLPGTATVDVGLLADTDYYYKVEAVNNGVAGPLSDYAHAKTKPSAPATPQGITATALSSSSIQVSWGAVDGATGYYLYRSMSENGPYAQIATVTGTSYTDTGLTADTGYYYKVAAYSGGGTSAQSAYAYAKTIVDPPLPPVGITATALSSSSIYVQWNAVNGATGYYLYCSASAGGPYTQIATLAGTSYTDTGLTANTGYFYKVAAYNNGGTGVQTPYAYAKTLPLPPSQPTGLSATALDTSRIQVSWNASSGATGYYLYRSRSANGTYTQVAILVGTSYTDTGLAADTVYYYKLAAYNSGGLSTHAGPVDARTKPNVLDQPSLIGAIEQSSYSIRVYWSSVAEATGYRVYRSTAQNGSYTQIATVGTASYPFYLDTGLKAGTVYYYKVEAFNSSLTSAQAGPAWARTVGIPSITVRALDSRNMQITWGAVPEARTYYIYRSVGYPNAFTFIGSTSSTSYVDAMIQTGSGMNYYYKVYALSKNGAQGDFSPYGYAYLPLSRYVTYGCW